MAGYIKILSLNNSLGNCPTYIFANEDKCVYARMFKTVANSRTLSKQIIADSYDTILCCVKKIMLSKHSRALEILIVEH